MPVRKWTIFVHKRTVQNQKKISCKIGINQHPSSKSHYYSAKMLINQYTETNCLLIYYTFMECTCKNLLNIFIRIMLKAQLL